jgi:hypothetical protein
MTVKFGAIASMLAALMVGACSGLWGNDEFERYTQRTDAITMSAGDAKQVNAVTHMYDPWPPGVGDRQIVADGVRMQRALERYRRGARPPDPLPDINLEGIPIGTALPSEPPPRGGGGVPGPAVGAPTPNQGQ